MTLVEIVVRLFSCLSCLFEIEKAVLPDCSLHDAAAHQQRRPIPVVALPLPLSDDSHVRNTKQQTQTHSERKT